MPPKKPQPAADNPVLAKLLKEGLLVRGTDARLEVERIPFGIPELDAIIGGGVPRNRISTLLGEESNGKTFLLQMLLRNAMEHGLTTAYIDLEHAFVPEWWEAVGLPPGKIYVSQPPTGEKAVDIVKALVQAEVDIVAVDSLAALTPSFELEEDTEKNQVGMQARLIARMVRVITQTNRRTAVVCTNQVRENIGAPGPADNMPGGRALRHGNSMTIRIRREGWIKADGLRTGFNMRVVCTRNKVSTPFNECLLPFMFRGEIDMLALTVERGLEHGYITQVGPWYTVLGEAKAQGKNGVIQLLKDDPGLLARLEVAMGDRRE